MKFVALVAFIAVSAASARRTEIELVKHNPHTQGHHAVSKICQAADQDNYKPYESEEQYFEQTNFFGGVQSSRRTRQQVQQCCNKYSQYEKKQCLKNVRENYLDNHCDKGVTHICCKSEGTTRYTCFSKNPFGSRSVFEQERIQFDDLETDSSLERFQDQQERRRRFDQQEQRQMTQEMVEEIERQEEDLEQSQPSWTGAQNQFSYLEQQQDSMWAQEQPLQRQAIRQARKVARQALDVEQETEQEVLDIARNLRQAQRFQQNKLVDSDILNQEYETDSIYGQPELEIEQELEVVEGIVGQQNYQHQKHQAVRDARRVARQIRQQGGSPLEAQIAAQQIYQIEKQQAKLQNRRQPGRIVDEEIEQQIEEQQEIEGDFLRPDVYQVLKTPCHKSLRCQRKQKQSTEVAALNACQKNTQRNGRQTTKTCCESGAIVGEMAGRHNSDVCVSALVKFQYKAQGCGVNHKPQCKQAFVQCCKQAKRQGLRQSLRQDIDQEEIDQVLFNTQRRNNLL